MTDTDLLVLFHMLWYRPVVFTGLLERFGSATAVIETAGERDLLPVNLSRGKLDSCRRDYLRGVEMTLEWLEGDSRFLWILGDENYPELLAEIYDPPVVLFAEGCVEALSKPCLAMVGSRLPTRSGIAFAECTARDLVTAGWVVSSGLARGIDTASHRGALQGIGESPGRTIAVMATGADRIYPSGNRKLAGEVVGDGLLLSEFPLGSPVRAWHFPRRNRIVTGLARGVLVVEAAQKSGSLISARLALEQGREVFAVPGLISNRQSHGCHRLLREGATLVESATDVCEYFEMEFTGSIRSELALDSRQRTVAELVAQQPMSADDLANGTGLPIEAVLVTLVELELLGYVGQDRGGYVSLKGAPD